MEGRSEIETASCLMLLSRVGHNGGERRVFTCKTCMKEFPTFQALGGHRASHKKTKNDNQNDEELPEYSPKKPKTTSHECPICGLEFPLGQALGGHMRRHRNSGVAGGGRGSLVTRALLPETTAMIKKYSSSSGKRVVCLDLNLAAAPTILDQNLNLKLELGRTVY